MPEAESLPEIDVESSEQETEPQVIYIEMPEDKALATRTTEVELHIPTKDSTQSPEGEYKHPFVDHPEDEDGNLGSARLSKEGKEEAKRSWEELRDYLPQNATAAELRAGVTILLDKLKQYEDGPQAEYIDLINRSFAERVRSVERDEQMEEMRASNSPWVGVIENARDTLYDEEEAGYGEAFFMNFTEKHILSLKTKVTEAVTEEHAQKAGVSKEILESIYEREVTALMNEYLDNLTDEEIAKANIAGILENAIHQKYGAEANVNNLFDRHVNEYQEQIAQGTDQITANDIPDTICDKEDEARPDLKQRIKSAVSKIKVSPRKVITGALLAVGLAQGGSSVHNQPTLSQEPVRPDGVAQQMKDHDYSRYVRHVESDDVRTQTTGAQSPQENPYGFLYEEGRSQEGSVNDLPAETRDFLFVGPHREFLLHTYRLYNPDTTLTDDQVVDELRNVDVLTGPAVDEYLGKVRGGRTVSSTIDVDDEGKVSFNAVAFDSVALAEGRITPDLAAEGIAKHYLYQEAAKLYNSGYLDKVAGIDSPEEFVEAINTNMRGMLTLIEQKLKYEDGVHQNAVFFNVGGEWINRDGATTNKHTVEDAFDRFQDIAFDFTGFEYTAKDLANAESLQDLNEQFRAQYWDELTELGYTPEDIQVWNFVGFGSYESAQGGADFTQDPLFHIK